MHSVWRWIAGGLYFINTTNIGAFQFSLHSIRFKSLSKFIELFSILFVQSAARCTPSEFIDGHTVPLLSNGEPSHWLTEATESVFDKSFALRDISWYLLSLSLHFDKVSPIFGKNVLRVQVKLSVRRGNKFNKSCAGNM